MCKQKAFISQSCLTVEVDGSDVAKQMASFHRVHAAADSGAAGAQILVHAVQSVGHSINRVDHELNLAFLLVGRVPADPLLTCRSTHPPVTTLAPPHHVLV